MTQESIDEPKILDGRHTAAVEVAEAATAAFEAFVGEKEKADLMEFLSGLHERQERARIKHWVAVTGLAIATGIAWWVVCHWPRDE